MQLLWKCKCHCHRWSERLEVLGHTVSPLLYTNLLHELIIAFFEFAGIGFEDGDSLHQKRNKKGCGIVETIPTWFDGVVLELAKYHEYSDKLIKVQECETRLKFYIVTIWMHWLISVFCHLLECFSLAVTKVIRSRLSSFFEAPLD